MQVNSGKAIALVGKSVNLSGAVLTAENGRIELGGVQAGIVDLSYTSTEFQLDYGKIESFGDIQLVKQSLLDASGLTSGGIQLQGQNISFKDASNVLIQTLGSQAPNRIQVRAAGDLNLSGDVRIAPDMGMILGTTPVRFTTETLGSEKGADIDISARNLDLDEGGIFQSRTFSGASGGNITVNVAENIQINRSAPLNPSSLSGIAAATLSPGKSGNISVTASNINITNGGTISANNFGQGDSGNVDVNVSGTIKLIGVEPSLLSPSSIGSNALQQGDGGSVTVNTSKLIAEDGAFVNSATFNSGKGGQITVNASESIEVRGGSPGLFSSISASAPIAPEVFRQVAGIPDRPSGNSGSLIINTPKLRIDDGGEVAVNNNGTGNGGDLSINSNSILVNNAGKIIANTASGKGGNISLNLKESLIFRNNSFINTESLGTGNGGNISVNSPVIAGFENSDIIANAIEGNGGNIDITTQGIFGLEFRDELTEESDITASSKFGVNGTVAINNIGIDPGFGLVELPVELSDSSQQIASGCLNNKGSNFLITGKGGIPYSPNQHLISNQTWYDIRNFSTSRKPSNNIETTQISNKAAIVEATGFIRNQNGEIEFVSSESKPFSTEKVINCSGLST